MARARIDQARQRWRPHGRSGGAQGFAQGPVVGAARRRRPDRDRCARIGHGSCRVCPGRNAAIRLRPHPGGARIVHRRRRSAGDDHDRSCRNADRLERRPARIGDAVPDRFRRHAIDTDGAGRGAAGSRWNLGAQSERRLGGAGADRPSRGAARSQPRPGAKPDRPGGAAIQHRSRRGGRQGCRRRHVGQSRLLHV